MTNVVNVGYDSTNYYVVSTVRSARVLVDCGWPGTLGKLRAQLKRKDIDLEQIRYLLVTHYHPDHAGLAQELGNAGVRLLLIEEQEPYVAPLAAYMKPDNGFLPIRTETALMLRTADSRAFLTGIGLAGQIICTPGHTLDSVTLVLDDGKAFTGDLPPPPALPAEDTVCRSSWARIQALGATTLYPGHGGPAP
jgi:glyoxylase-like metal-dependent hydrolase (beta-lactamase superfamily II)